MEHLDPWPFVVGAYTLTLLATFVLLIGSLVAMRRAEKQVDDL
jgi:heme exporter protein D